MKVKCINNKVASLPEVISKNYSIKYEKFPVKEGKEYIVYALWVCLDYIWYCIWDEYSRSYPNWNPCVLFEVIDQQLSRHWIFNVDTSPIDAVPFLSFPEWANNQNFHDEMVDGSKNDPNIIIFNKYKELMDLEFPDSSISDVAQIGDNEWLICPNCIDAWYSDSDRDALVKCPKCKTIFNNPRYKTSKFTIGN